MPPVTVYLTLCVKMENGHAAVSCQVPTGDETKLRARIAASGPFRRTLLRMALPGLRTEHARITQVFVGNHQAYFAAAV